ncbi:MAG TPA: hypothetical protein VEI58_03055 [Chthoniobacterales bacterium]|nr:hypothetical protein [Chthoniobacterales bacterium]
MKTNRYLLLLICIWIGAYSSSFAATIPAGTTLAVETVNSVSARSTVGRSVEIRLARDVVINGKVVLKAGTPAKAKIETAVGDFRKSDHLSLDMTAISVDGRVIPLKTSGAYELQAPNAYRTNGGVAIYGRHTVFPHGTPMTFRLAQPLSI